LEEYGNGELFSGQQGTVEQLKGAQKGEHVVGKKSRSRELASLNTNKHNSTFAFHILILFYC